MKTTVRIIAVILLLLLQTNLKSENITFNYLGVADGLSQNSVTALAQDSIGRIWIGTRDGINLYDGSGIKVIRQERGNPNSLLGHFVNDIKIYGNDVWVVTKSGVSHVNIKNLTFTNYPTEGVFKIIIFEKKLLVGTKSGLLTLNPTLQKFEKNKILPSGNLNILNLYVDKSGTLWISTNKGLYAHFSGNVTIKILDVNATVAFVDSRRQVWIGTYDQGVFVLDPLRKLIRQFVHDKATISIASDLVRDIEEDAKGNIWVGTFKGLSVINSVDFSIKNYTSDDTSEKALSQNSIYCILRDKQDGMWLGTFFGGISYFNHGLYKQYQVTKDSERGLSFGVVGEMIEDDKSNLWIATEGGGLNYLDRETGKFTHFKHKEGLPGLSQDIVRSLFLIDKNTLLIGTHLGGLNILDIKTGKIKVFLHNPGDPNSIPSNIVRDIIHYHGVILLATEKGVVKFNPVTNQFSLFVDKKNKPIVDGLVNCLHEDSFGSLWIGTEDYGLFSYNRQTGKVTRYKTSSTDFNTIGDNNIACIYEDHLFRLWIGTSGGGLNQFIRDRNTFKSYNITTHNFPSNFILKIQESNYGNLWISTSKGLSLLDVDRNHVYNYSQKNGFPLPELNQGALYLTNNGELFVGGISGLVSFAEKSILNQKQRHNITFESLIVNNKEVLPDDDNDILKNTLAFTDKITLKPNQNVFTINYSACNYVKSNKNTYRYKLENFDKEWVNAGDQTSVTYTNLNPGTYNLTVQGLNGVEGNIIGEKGLEIEILPPIYKTWYAYIIYILISVFIFLWVKRMYRNRVILENRIKTEQREKDQISILNQSKLEFFTNISHEFRTPLTLIAGTLESIVESKKSKEEILSKIAATHRNVLRLNNLVTELLDFRKLELGYNTLKVSKVNLTEFLDNIYQSFTDYASLHNIEFLNEINRDFDLWLDKNQMEKVFYNLLSNAFKFVDDVHGRITISVIEAQNHVDVLISDNGIGISSEKLANIFDPYYQIDNIKINPKRKGSGIGLALCKNIMKEHKGDIMVVSDEGGTEFTIRLLKGKDHYKENDFATEHIVHEKTTGNILVEPAKLFIMESTKNADLMTNPVSILIVEDNVEVRKLVRGVFEPYYKIFEAEDGEIGVKMAIEIQPDLIISDVMMPKVSGTELCTMLKRNFQTSHIPVILLTAKATEDFEIEGLETGADAYMTKPFSNKLLKAKVKNILQNRQLLHQKFKSDPTIEITEVTSNIIDQKFLKQAKEIVEKHLDNTEFITNVFAAEMGVGRSKLYDKIKGITGLTPNDFIVSVRLAKAAEMLIDVNAERNISEIAYSVGFSTASYFSKCFKDHFGVTPTEYVEKSSAKKQN